jgi:hypothetical protein
MKLFKLKQLFTSGAVASGDEAKLRLHADQPDSSIMSLQADDRDRFYQLFSIFPQMH